MTDLTPIRISKRDLGRRAEIYTYLEDICRDLDLTKKQHSKARKEYLDVAKWLSGSYHSLMAALDVYPQGSTALGTAVRPLGRDEFDVDLICLLLLLSLIHI